MYEAHPVFQTPPDESRIWRYMDLAKFVWLVKERALYFPRADQLGDPFEGSLPRPNVEARTALIEETSAATGQEWVWARGIDPARPSWTTNVSHLFVSCWNLSDHENALLWQVYGRGVAIESTVGALMRSLRTDDRVYIGSVNYIDYEHEGFPGGNGYYPIVHKRRFFAAEHELRAVIPGATHADPDDDSVWTGDPRSGVVANVDLNQLVARVWVAPGARLLHEVVASIVDQYDVNAEVQQSSLDDEPAY